MKPKYYLGDAVYAELQNSNLVLTTENGIHVTNIIILEPEIVEALFNYLGASSR